MLVRLRGFLVTFNAMIDGYVKVGCVGLARNFFYEMRERNVVSWTSSGFWYCGNGDVENARLMFDLMPNKVTVVCVLPTMTNLDLGFFQMKKLDRLVCVGIALVNMYAKCDENLKEKLVMKEITKKKMTCWNVLIFYY
ncbi:Pentatricopeptide repeat-containing protein, partial [Mucuna pruriens]